MALGRFDYDRRGILDAGHVRFFTRRSFERMVRASGLRVRRRETVGMPQQVVRRGAAEPVSGTGTLGRLLARLNELTVVAWPTLFGYQFVYELEHDPDSA